MLCERIKSITTLASDPLFNFSSFPPLFSVRRHSLKLMSKTAAAAAADSNRVNGNEKEEEKTTRVLQLQKPFVI